MTNKQKNWKNIISIEIDEKTQEEILKNPELTKTLQKVFDAVWWIQDKIDEKSKLKDK